jgi:hypothetical protein
MTDTSDDDEPDAYDIKRQIHKLAVADPRPGFESAITALVYGLCSYREAYAARYHAELSESPHVADDWLTVARGIIGLLDGDTDRLHCPSVDGLIRATAQQAGFSLTLERKPG